MARLLENWDYFARTHWPGPPFALEGTPPRSIGKQGAGPLSLAGSRLRIIRLQMIGRIIPGLSNYHSNLRVMFSIVRRRSAQKMGMSMGNRKSMCTIYMTYNDIISVMGGHPHRQHLNANQ